MVKKEIDVQAQVGPMQSTSDSLQAFLGAVQCGTPRLSEIETVIHIVANAEVALVGAVGRRQPDKAIPGHEQVRCAFLNCAIRGLKPLEDRRRQFVRRYGRKGAAEKQRGEDEDQPE